MFGSLSSAHQIMVLLTLKGGGAYDAQMQAASMETNKFKRALIESAAGMNLATKRSFLHNQSLYTLRRYAFYATLGVTALVAEIGRLGFSYNTTKQGAQVALRGIFSTREEMNRTIGALYKMSTLSPFLFKDTLSAFRTLYPAFHAVGFSTALTLKVMQGAMNGLAESGRASTGSLTRIGVQLQHLANIGRPTGQVLLALARDGLPVYPALRKELGLTGTSLENLATSGLTAKQVLQALAKYETTVAPFAGAAKRLAESTLQGNWQMFKDILAQAAGTAEGGLFKGLQDRLKAVNNYLAPLFQNNKPITLYNIAQAMDHALTPNSHMLLNTFITLTSVLSSMMTSFGRLFQVISGISGIIGKITGLFGASSTGASVFGTILGKLAFIFILAKLTLMPFVIMIDLYKAGLEATKTVMLAFRVIQAILNGEWAAAWALITGNTIATEANTVANTEGAVAAASRAEAGAALAASYGVEAVGASASIAPTLGFAAAMDIAAASAIALFAALLPLALIAGVAYLFFAPHSPNRLGYQGLKHHRWFPHAHHGHTGGSAVYPTGSQMSHLASGGTVTQAGYSWVGEHGPELMHLPVGAQVKPLEHRSLTGEGSIVVHVYPQDIYMDGRKVGYALSQAITDKQARMSGRTT